MNERDTETSAKRVVAGWEVFLRRRHQGEEWEICLVDQVINLTTCIRDRVLLSRRPDGKYFRGKTYKTPEVAARAVKQLLAG